jgi:hypothetical protein
MLGGPALLSPRDVDKMLPEDAEKWNKWQESSD